MVKRNSIILLIKNDYTGFEYLTYLDKGWDTLFFPHFTDDGQSEEDLKAAIAKRFWCPKYEVKLKYLDVFSETKASQEHNNEIREYKYKIYKVILARTDFQRFPTFNFNGTDYRWNSFDKLQNDPQVQKNNATLVDFIEHLELN